MIGGLLGRARLIGVHEEFDSVEIESAVANRTGNSNPFGAPVGKKFNFDFCAHGQIRNREKAHSDVAEIDAEGVEVTRSAENTH